MTSATEMELAVEKNRKNLETKTVKELIKEYATPLNIKGRHDMKKADLIQAILMEYATEDKNKNKQNKEYKLTDVQLTNKMRYIEGLEIGTIVAFKLPGMKVKSAKVIRKSTKNRKCKVETAYGAVFVVCFDDIIWVKTNKRWPKGIYNLLKGIDEGV